VRARGAPPPPRVAAGGREVRAYVAPVPAAVGPDLPVEEALRLMREGGRDALPVMEGGHVVGVVTRTELEAAARAGGRGGRARLAEAAGLRVVYCFADSDVADAAATMRAARVSHLAVLGEDVRLLGLLARRDLPPASAA
jgi:CBS domain-containing protein